MPVAKNTMSSNRKTKKKARPKNIALNLIQKYGLLARILARTRSSVLTRALYRQKKWRSMRASGKLKKQRCDAHMLKSFEAKFGAPEKVLEPYEASPACQAQGLSQGAPQGRVCRPARRRVPDFQELCQPPVQRRHVRDFQDAHKPKTLHEDEDSDRHCTRLAACQGCNTLWNRDVLASINMVKIAMAASKGEARPERFKKRPRTT